MSLEQTDATKGLVNRVKGILLKPGAEWDVIDREPATVNGLFTGYAMILAAIGPIATAVGSVVFDVGALGISYHASPVTALVTALIGYVLSLAGVFILSLIIDLLAPSFGGTQDKVQATKVAVYAATAAWVAGIFGLLPALKVLGIIGGLYSLYLFYLGLPKLMKAPQDKALSYTAVVIIVAIIVNVVIVAATAAIAGAVGLGAAGAFSSVAQAGHASGKVKVGDSEIDLGALEAQAKQAEASAKQLQAQVEGKTVEGAVAAVPADTLKGLLPAAVAGYARTTIESSSGGVGGLQGSNAEGEYAKGDSRFTLNVTDMAAAGGLAGMAGAFNVSSNKETATGYEKLGKVDGRMTTENYDHASKSGEYSVLVANRFMVQAQGTGVSMDELKAAVGAVGLGRLEGLAKG